MSIQTVSAQSFFGRNLIVNPGAEEGVAQPEVALIRPIPGWTPVGNFNIEPYGKPGLIAASDPGPPNRGARFFSGGPNNASSSATQDIQVPPEAFSAIDAGTVKYDLSAWLGGFGTEGDNAALTIRFNPTPALSTFSPVLTGTIPVGGSRTIQTDGIAGSPLEGWAELVSANSVGGFAIFRQRVEGRPDQEAAVPMISGMGRFALPFDNTEGFVTSMALVKHQH